MILRRSKKESVLEVALNEINWYNCIGKSKKHKGNLWMLAVVPRAGTWIETPMISKLVSTLLRRSPCGNVD